jgi:hypothetical protein
MLAGKKVRSRSQKRNLRKSKSSVRQQRRKSRSQKKSTTRSRKRRSTKRRQRGGGDCSEWSGTSAEECEARGGCDWKQSTSTCDTRQFGI